MRGGGEREGRMDLQKCATTLVWYQTCGNFSPFQRTRYYKSLYRYHVFDIFMIDRAALHAQ